MNAKNKNSSIVGGLFWTFAERISAQLVSTIVTIILARLLDPEHYGIISIVTVFISVCNIFVSSGFGSAVVQKKEANDIDFNTAFILSFSISIFLYVLIFLFSPLIASFYKMPQLVSIMRIMGIRIPLAALNSIQQAHIQREMKFKKFFVATFIGTIISAFVGIILAVLGFGAWALVAQYLTNTIIDSIVLLIVGSWHPKLEFSKKRAKNIFSFGWKVLVTDLIFTLESDIRSLIVGKVFGSSDLAYYDQGKKYPSILVTNINTSINKVMLPAYSKSQSDLNKLKEMLRKSIRIGIYLLAPILIGFALVSKNFVILVLTEKWLPCVPYIQLFCLSFLTRPLESSCHQALLAIGRSDLVLYIMLSINVFALLTVLIAVFVFKSVFLIAVGSLISTFVSLISFMSVIKHKIKYSFKEQIYDIAPTLLLSFVMGIVVILIGLLNIHTFWKLLLQIICGAISYVLMSQIFNIEPYEYLKIKLKNMLVKPKMKEEL